MVKGALGALAKRHGINQKTVVKRKRPRYDSQAQLTARLQGFINADDHSRRRKPQRGRTPCEHIWKRQLTSQIARN